MDPNMRKQSKNAEAFGDADEKDGMPTLRGGMAQMAHEEQIYPRRSTCPKGTTKVFFGTLKLATICSYLPFRIQREDFVVCGVGCLLRALSSSGG